MEVKIERGDKPVRQMIVQESWANNLMPQTFMASHSCQGKVQTRTAIETLGCLPSASIPIQVRGIDSDSAFPREAPRPSLTPHNSPESPPVIVHQLPQQAVFESYLSLLYLYTERSAQLCSSLLVTFLYPCSFKC